jgi:hypothetical protein
MLGLQGPQGARWFSTRTLKREEDRVWLERPLEWPSQLEDGEEREILLDISRPTDARYRARGQMVATELPEGVVAVRIIDAERIQRREFFRVETCITADEAILEEADGSQVALRLYVINLSAGGLAARIAPAYGEAHELTLGMGAEITITFQLPGQADPLRLRARIVRLAPATGPSVLSREIAGEFVHPRPADRERLIRYALRVQTEYIRRGLI